MKKVFLIPAIGLFLMMANPVFGWNPLSVTGKCQSTGQVTWTVSASQQEDDNLIQVSSDKDFSTPTNLQLDTKTLSVSVTNSWTKIWARWSSDHTVVSAGAVDKCNVPNHPKPTPPATDTSSNTTTTDNDLIKTYYDDRTTLGIFAVIAIVIVFTVYLLYKGEHE